MDSAYDTDRPRTNARRLPRPFILVLVLALIAGACGSDGDANTTQPSGSDSESTTTTDSGGDDPTSGDARFFMTFANITNAGALQVAIRDGVVRAAEVVDVEVKLYDNNADDETALRNANLMINDSPDVIAEFNLSAAVNETIGGLFNDAGIACIGVNIPVPGCPWFRLDNGGLGAETGAVMGQFAVDRGWTGADTTVIVLSAWAAGEDVNAGVGQFYKEVSAVVPDMEQIDPSEIGPQTARIGDNFVQVDTDLLLETGFQGVNEVLASIAEDRNLIIFGVNDDVVSGAIQAVEGAGRTDTTIAAGLGGGEAINNLRDNPIWLAEADVFFDFWGQYIVAMAAAHVEGIEIPDVTEIPIAVLTKETVDDFYAPGETVPLMLPPVPEANEYLIPLGILQEFGNIQGLS